MYGMSEKQTVGQYRVGTDFNPSGQDSVTRLKQKAAAFIDECNDLREAESDRFIRCVPAEEGTRHYDVLRCLEQAMAQAENAAMWAVKGVTKPQPK